MTKRKTNKIKPPRRPIEPFKPIEPKPFLEGTKMEIGRKTFEQDRISFSDLYSSLKKICKSESLDGLDNYTFTFNGGDDLYRDHYSNFEIIVFSDEDVPNPAFELQMKYYNKDLAFYEKAKLKYDKDFARYEKYLKEYESSLLEKQLDACEKKIKQIKKQLELKK